MNSPTPSLPPSIPPSPSLPLATGATGLALLLSYGASWAAQKYGVPYEVAGSLLGGIFTALTTVWHKYM